MLELADGTVKLIPVEDCPYGCAIYTRNNEEWDKCGKSPISCSVFLSVLYTAVFVLSICIVAIIFDKCVKNMSDRRYEKRIKESHY